MALINALDEPAKSSPDLRDMGITHEWLEKNASNVVIPQFQGTPSLSERQKRFFQETFTNEDVVRTLMVELVQSRHTDDYPFVSVVVTRKDQAIELKSGSQFPYMLPWKIKNITVEREAFNADISRAIADLLPATATNKARLSSGPSADLIAQAVGDRIQDQMNLLGVEDSSGSTLAQLRAKYSVLSAEIDGFHHPEYGKDWEHGDPGVRNLHVSLHRRDMPSNVTTLLVLPLKNGQVTGVSEFLREDDRYEESLHSATGLMGLIKNHPAIPVRVSYVDGSSLGEKGWQTFSSDMKKIGKGGLLEQIRPIRSTTTLLITGNTYAESYWLLLQDGRTLLWRYNGPSGLFRLNTQEFETKDCAFYGEPSGGCVGMFLPLNK